MAPIGRDRHGPDPARMAFKRAQCLAGFQVPEPQRSVIRACHSPAPIGRYRHGPEAGMALERADRLAALQVPNPQRSVIRARDRAATVGRYRHSIDPAGMAFERRIVWPLSRSQSRSVWSSEPETARRPSGVTATALTRPVWPWSVRWFGRSPSPRAAAFGRPRPRRTAPIGCYCHGVDRARMAFERADQRTSGRS